MKVLDLFVYLNTLLSYTSSGDIIPTRDGHNCLIDKGFSWCEEINTCIRIWETPCKDNYIDCEDCLFRQRLENIACPPECNIDSHEIVSGGPCPSCSPPPCPPPGPDCHYSSPILDDCGCIDDCGLITCSPPEETDDGSQCPITQPSCSNYEFICPEITEVTECSEGGIDGFTTYRLSVRVKDHVNVKNIYALFGESSDHELYLPPAYQIDGPFNSNIGGVSPSIIQIFPDAFYDSWITIDITDGDPSNQLSTIGIDFNEWSDTNGITTSNGAIFQIDPNDNNYKNEYILGQMTIPNYVNDVLTFNVQGREVNDDSWKEYDVTFNLNPSDLIQNPIPLDCVLWYDGCNLCQVTNGNLGLCTSNSCLVYEDTFCHSHSHSGGH